MYFTQKGTAEMKKLTSGASGQMFSLCRRSKENTRVHTRAHRKRSVTDRKSCIFISLFFLVAHLMEAELLPVGLQFQQIASLKKAAEKR